jgi:hypothetical protein
MGICLYTVHASLFQSNGSLMSSPIFSAAGYFVNSRASPSVFHTPTELAIRFGFQNPPPPSSLSPSPSPSPSTFTCRISSPKSNLSNWALSPAHASSLGERPDYIGGPRSLLCGICADAARCGRKVYGSSLASPGARLPPTRSAGPSPATPRTATQHSVDRFPLVSPPPPLLPRDVL